MKKIVALVLSLVMVLGLATTAFASTTTPGIFDLHQADAKGSEIAGDIGYTLHDAKTDALGGGELAYYSMIGKYFVEIAAADATTADFYVTKANEKTPLFYLTEISAGDNEYVAVATEYTNIGIKCGELNVPYVMTVAELGFYAVTNPVNGKQTLYVEYDKTAAAGTYAAVTAPYFNGKGFTTTTPVQLLVDDEIVVAYQIGAVDGAALALNQHVFSPVAYDKTTPVKALCGLCGAEAVVYKTGKAPAGSVVIPATFGTTNYDLVITAAATTTPDAAGDKVESAETFDAGIAMYVGMSVMAAAGSAVVLKKKD